MKPALREQHEHGRRVLRHHRSGRTDGAATSRGVVLWEGESAGTAEERVAVPLLHPRHGRTPEKALRESPGKVAVHIRVMVGIKDERTMGGRYVSIAEEPDIAEGRA